MYQEITLFTRWLRCKHPHSSTPQYYVSDLHHFFTWANTAPAKITVSDVDAYIAHCKTQGHAIATINRRLAALSALYQFLHTHTDNPPANPVIPRRHRLKQGRRLPHTVPDDILDRLFAIIASPRDKAIFTLMLRCGLRVAEVIMGRRCGVSITPHQLRYSCATLLLNTGAPILTVQRVLGHRYVQTTLRYTRLFDATVVRDFRRVMGVVENKEGG